MNPNAAAAKPPSRDSFLVVLGDRVRRLRLQRGETRKSLALSAQISERHLANLETGQGNASVLLLKQLAVALGCSIAELVGEDPPRTADGRAIQELLRGRDEATLKRVRETVANLLEGMARDPQRTSRIALIGLRGAGKSTLGRMLADDRRIPFVELDRVVERLAGCDIHEIHALYGDEAYRRYEARALEDTITAHPVGVIATGGGLVGEAATYELLRARCFTIWLRASPEEHMQRVVAQGDLRPMAGNTEAMADLKRILAGREAAYAHADLTFDTGAKSLADTFLELRERLAQEVSAPA